MARTSKYQQINYSPAQARWRVGLYIRLSREDGDKPESESIGSQKALLQKYADEHPEMQVFEIYADDGWSGTDFNRPAFQKMLKDAANKKINCVIVKDLSRFGRNYVEAGKYLETVFPLFGVRFIAVNDQIDSAANPSSVNNIIVPFKNIINDEYCRDISVKVRSALDIRRKQGKFIGSFAAYGYKKDETDRGKLIIDEEAAKIVRLIFKRFMEGASISGIARELNANSVPNPSAYKKQKGLNCNRGTSGGLWVDTTVRRILSNELYIGNLVQKKNEVISYKIHKTRTVEAPNRIVAENTHKAIIPRADFERAQNLLARDTRVSPKTRRLSVFSGFVKCADCGRAMQKRTVVQPNKTYEYYVCSTYKKLDKTACTKHAIRADLLEEIVLTVLNKYIEIAVNFDRLSAKVRLAQKNSEYSKRLATELNAKRADYEKAQKMLIDIYPDFKSGLLSREQYLALKEKYENACICAKSAIEKTEKEINAYNSGADGANEFITAFKKYKKLQTLTREIVAELIENIYIREGGEVELHLKCKDAYLSASEYFDKNTALKSADLI